MVRYACETIGEGTGGCGRTYECGRMWNGKGVSVGSFLAAAGSGVQRLKASGQVQGEAPGGGPKGAKPLWLH